MSVKSQFTPTKIVKQHRRLNNESDIIKLWADVHECVVELTFFYEFTPIFLTFDQKCEAVSDSAAFIQSRRSLRVTEDFRLFHQPATGWRTTSAGLRNYDGSLLPSPNTVERSIIH